MKRKILMTLAFLLAIAQVAWAEGELTGKFTVNSSGKQVCFSQGNLQYIGSAETPYWKFADHQWEYIGSAQGGSTASNINRDLFGWGTKTNPYNTSSNGNDYQWKEWGDNAIANGGNTDNSGWRTLTNDEWVYLFNSRTNAAQKYGHGSVKVVTDGPSVHGMIILPDTWTMPDGLSFTPGNSEWANSYTTEQWTQMEAAGAVFLPAAGCRSGDVLGAVGDQGSYWSSSLSGMDMPFCVDFTSNKLNPQSYSVRSDGYSVRLVKDAVPHNVFFAAGSGSEDGWSIDPLTAADGTPVIVSYTGVHKVKNVTVKGKSVVTAAPTPNVLTYTGSAQALVSAGTATCGNLVYSLTSGSGYSTSIPTATNAGNYTVYYKVDGGSGYTGTPEQSVNVTIAKAAATLSLDNTTPLSFTSSQASGTVYEPSHVATFTGGTLTATSANTDNCTVSVNQFSNTIIVTRVNNAAFSNTQITVSVTPDDNHTAPSSSVTFYVSAEVFSQTFTYAGHHFQTFTAPATGWYTLKAYGAQGGNCGTNNGGLGGYATIKYHLNANQTLYIYVGEQGGSNDGSGGWNGGGNGVAGGGGASHIATSDIGSITSGTNLNINGTDPVNGLLLVAGGGGGAGHDGSTAGEGGGFTGEAGQNKDHTSLSSWNNGNYSYGASGSAEGNGGGGGGFIGGSANQSTSGTNQYYGGSGGRSWGNESDPNKGVNYSTTSGDATEGGHGKVVITYYGTTAQ